MDNSLTNKLAIAINSSKIVIVCIGTDLLSGDCLGPLVGQMLIEKRVPCFVYGTLKFPVTALNIDKVNKFIRDRHKGNMVVAIDSAVGEKVGSIKVSRGSLKPGSASGKKLLPIGDVSITVTTTTALPHEENFALVPLGFVYMTAKRLVKSIIEVAKNNTLYNNETKLATKIE